MTGADTWLHTFHEVMRANAAKLSQCEMEKGELEAGLMLIGSKVLTMFPGDIEPGAEIINVTIRLLEELRNRRATEKPNAL